jgi:2-amino-4-hydroxy-6-hydroxymethyldihydropteridine diphosphokinase
MVARREAALRTWYLGLGSNVGDREGRLREALRRLGETPGIAVEAVSQAYETDPWGDADQGAFLNLVAQVASSLDPPALLAEAKRIEREVGRQPRRRWGPREIDIDLLWAGGLRVETPELTVPHPLMAERQFVLVPLAELAPALQLPDGSTVSSLVRDDGSVRPYQAAHRTSQDEALPCSGSTPTRSATRPATP